MQELAMQIHKSVPLIWALCLPHAMCCLRAICATPRNAWRGHVQVSVWGTQGTEKSRWALRQTAPQVAVITTDVKFIGLTENLIESNNQPLVGR